jgi:hypothetical protein
MTPTSVSYEKKLSSVGVNRRGALGELRDPTGISSRAQAIGSLGLTSSSYICRSCESISTSSSRRSLQPLNSVTIWSASSTTLSSWVYSSGMISCLICPICISTRAHWRGSGVFIRKSCRKPVGLRELYHARGPADRYQAGTSTITARSRCRACS